MSTMSNQYVFIETSQYRQEASKWLKALKRQENATAVFIPKTDRLIRLMHLLNDHVLIRDMLGDPDEYFFLRINIDPHDTEELDDLTFQIAELLNLSKITPNVYSFKNWIDHFTKHSLKLILVLPEAEKYLSITGKHVLALISDLNEKYAPMIRILSFFETDILNHSYLQLMPSSTRLYENICHYPLYSTEDTLKFIHLLENLWGITVETKTKTGIIAACGGHLWLVKEAIREISASGVWSIQSEDMRFRLRTTYDLLLPSERSVLRKIITHNKKFDSEEKLSISFLEKMRVINSKKQCLIGAYTDFLLSLKHPSETLHLEKDSVYFNEVPVDKVFSRKELRVLKLLLEKANMIVPREEIGLRMWPIDTQSQFSEWAIDQLISRLRKRLVELSISPILLESVRGKGYRLNLPSG